MDDRLVIKDVTLAFATGHLDSTYDYHHALIVPKIIIEFEVYKIATCVIDEKLNNAIDLETNEVFHILERDQDGYIKNSEMLKMANGEIYALRMREKEWNKLSNLNQLKLKSRAKKVYKGYLEQRQSELEEKVKKIGEKKS